MRATRARRPRSARCANACSPSCRSNARAGVMRHFAERDIDDLAVDAAAVRSSTKWSARSTRSAACARAISPTLVCATRASALAMWQTRSVMAQLAGGGIPSTVLTVTTKGDAVQDRPLAAIGTDSVFVKELELALRERPRRLRRALVQRFAEHAARRHDVRRDRPARRSARRVLQREATRRSTRCPPARASARRVRAGARCCARCAPTSTIDDIRGNVDTRLRKLRDGEYDAIVLAAAGLKRLGARAPRTPCRSRSTCSCRPSRKARSRSRCAPAIRASRACARCSTIRKPSLPCTPSARSLRTLRGGCQAPVGAHAVYDGEFLLIHAAIAARRRFDRDSRRPARHDDLRRPRWKPPPSRWPRRCSPKAAPRCSADRRTRPGRARSPVRSFCLPRTQERPSRIAAALREAGAEVDRGGRRRGGRSGPRRPHAQRDPLPVVGLGAGDRGLSRRTSRRAADRRRDGPGVGGGRRRRPAGRPTSSPPEADIAAFVHTVTHFVLEHTT